jgi:hypothetical protein
MAESGLPLDLLDAALRTCIGLLNRMPIQQF